MPTSIFAGCTDTCGWIAAVVAVLCYGTFGVPLKTSVSVEVNFLVMQSYKTIVCFCTSWLVILLGEEVRWSSWGIASGLFWVPGAACGVYGIRNAGLAIAVGTWSSIMVLTSFIFGILVFKENVKSLAHTCAAFTLLICGLLGMSKYSAHVPVTSSEGKTSTLDHNYGTDKSSVKLSVVAPVVGALRRMCAPVVPIDVMKRTGSSSSDNGGGGGGGGGGGSDADNSMMTPLEMEPLTNAGDDEDDIMGHGNGSNGNGNDVDTKKSINKDRLVFLGGRISLTRRELGVLGAVVNGAWGGMNLIPLHFALRDDGLTGAGYLISYATGALIVNTGIWLLLYLYYVYQKKGQWQEALEALPKWHLKELWFPGLMAGLLYSLGNFSAILAVTYLGHGTGFSFCQMQLFVSGLWGVFYFKEIRGTATITKWFASAFVAVFGIIYLSYQHEGASGGHRRLHCFVDTLKETFPQWA